MRVSIASILLGLTLGCSGDPGVFTSAGGTATVGTSSNADFASVQTAIDASPPGTLIQIEPGTYRGQLVVNKDLRLIGSGPGTVLEAVGTRSAFPDESSDNSSAVLVIRNTSNVVIENMRFSGPQDGIQVRSAQQITLRNVEAVNNGDDGIDVRASSQVAVSGVFSGNGDKGVQVREGSSRFELTSGTVADNVDDGVRIRDSATITVRSGSLLGNGDDGIEVRDSSGVTVADSTISGNAGFGIRIRNAPDTTLTNNTVAGNTDGDVRRD